MNQSNLLTVRVAGVMNRQAVVLHAGRTLPCLLSGRLLRQKDSQIGRASCRERVSSPV